MPLLDVYPEKSKYSNLKRHMHPLILAVLFTVVIYSV